MLPCKVRALSWHTHSSQHTAHPGVSPTIVISIFLLFPGPTLPRPTLPVPPPPVRHYHHRRWQLCRCLAAAETPALMAAPPAPRPPPAHSPDTQFRMSATQSAAPRGRHRHQKHAPRLHMPRRTPPASCYQRLRSSQLQPFLRCCASPDMGLYRLPLASTPHCPPDLRHAAPRHRSRPRRRDVTWVTSYQVTFTSCHLAASLVDVPHPPPNASAGVEGPPSHPPTPWLHPPPPPCPALSLCPIIITLQ